MPISFFKQSDSISVDLKQALTRVSVDVGGNGECGVRSFLASLLDSAMHDPEGYFPAVAELIRLSKQSLNMANSVEEMKKGLKQLHDPNVMQEFITKMSPVLREAACEEAKNNIQEYQAFFPNQQALQQINAIKKPGVWIEQWVVAAWAKKFDVPLIVRMRELDKPVYNEVPHNVRGNDKRAPLVVTHHDIHYTANVINPKPFTRTAAAPVSEVTINDVDMDPKEIDALMARLIEQDTKTLESYENHFERLQMMLMTEEISRESLLAAYIKSLNQSDYLSDHPKQLGTENGLQHFFETILIRSRQWSEGKIENLQVTDLAKQLDQSDLLVELLRTSARALSIGHFNENDFYEQIQNVNGANLTISQR